MISKHFLSFFGLPFAVLKMSSDAQNFLIEGLPTEFLASPPQNCPDHEKQGKSETLSQP